MTPTRGLPVTLVVFIMTLLTCAPTLADAASDTSDINVHVEKDGSTIRVQVDFPVNVPHEIVWDVLTDYDHMTKFVPNLEQSVVRMRLGNRLQVFQKGKATRGPLSFAFENVREVELTPTSEIRSRMISGDSMPAEFTTRIEERDGRQHILQTGMYTPTVWVPPLIGVSLIEGETRKQYGAIRDEMLRRAASAK